jgi:hypothetical protein
VCESLHQNDTHYRTMEEIDFGQGTGKFGRERFAIDVNRF